MFVAKPSTTTAPPSNGAASLEVCVSSTFSQVYILNDTERTSQDLSRAPLPLEASKTTAPPSNGAASLEVSL